MFLWISESISAQFKASKCLTLLLTEVKQIQTMFPCLFKLHEWWTVGKYIALGIIIWPTVVQTIKRGLINQHSNNKKSKPEMYLFWLQKVNVWSGCAAYFWTRIRIVQFLGIFPKAFYLNCGAFYRVIHVETVAIALKTCRLEFHYTLFF